MSTEIQGDALTPSLGDSKGAMGSHDKARSILLAYWRNHPFEPQAGVLLFSTDLSTQLILDPAAGLPRLDQDVALAAGWVRARPNEPRAMRAAANLYAMRTHIRVAAGDLSGSLEDCERAENLVLQIIQRWPGDWTDYARIGSDEANCGYAFTKMGAIREALTAYDKAEAKFRAAMAMTKDSVSLRRELGVIDGRQSELLILEGDTGDAMRAIRRSLQTLQSLALADPLNTSIHRDLALAHVRNGRVLMALSRRPSALQELEQAVRIFKELPGASLFVSAYYASALNDLGRALLRDLSVPSVKRAAECFQAAVALVQRDFPLAPSNIELLRERARATRGLAEVARIRSGRQSSEAVQLLRSAVADWHLLRQRSPLYRKGLDEQAGAERELGALSRR
jgi:tetratricopeptide (TPR) repeat protein